MKHRLWDGSAAISESSSADPTGTNFNVSFSGYVDASSGSKTVELQYYNATATANGLGIAISPIGVEIYTTITVTQVG